MTPTRAQLKDIFETAKPAILDAVLDQVALLTKAKIDTPLRLAGFFASIGVESGGLRVTEENLNYSAKRLRQVFPKYYKTDAQAAADGGKPQKIAVKVYGGRLGNKPAPSTDGWDYRGGGLMQTTGRTNYRLLGYESNPEALRDPRIAFQTAVREWTNRKCNALADKKDWAGIRKAINGGLNGFDHFMAYVAEARSVFGSAQAVGLIPQPEAQDAPPVPEAIEDKETVEFVQSALSGLGYTEVGGIDGKMGKLTVAAILAFRNEEGMPLLPQIDSEFLDVLAKAKPREFAPERAQITTARTTELYPEAKTAWYQKVTGGVAAAGAAGVGAVKGVVDYISPSSEQLAPIRDLVNDIPSGVWIVGVIVVAGVMWWLGRRGTREVKQAVRDGRRR